MPFKIRFVSELVIDDDQDLLNLTGNDVRQLAAIQGIQNPESASIVLDETPVATSDTPIIQHLHADGMRQLDVVQLSPATLNLRISNCCRRIPVEFTVESTWDSSIGDVKDEIERRKGLRKSYQKLSLGARELRNETILSNIMCSSNISLRLEAAEDTDIMVRVKAVNGKSITVAMRTTSTVAQLKNTITIREGMPAAKQRMIHSGRLLNDSETLSLYGGRLLDDSNTLGTYGVRDGDTIHILVLGDNCTACAWPELVDKFVGEHPAADSPPVWHSH